MIPASYIYIISIQLFGVANGSSASFSKQTQAVKRITDSQFLIDCDCPLYVYLLESVSGKTPSHIADVGSEH